MSLGRCEGVRGGLRLSNGGKNNLWMSTLGWGKQNMGLQSYEFSSPGDLGKTGKSKRGSPEQNGKRMAPYGTGIPGWRVSEGSDHKALWLGGCGQWLCLATGPVPVVGVLEKVLAGNVGTEAGTGQESPCQLAVQGIGLLGGWAEPVP